MKRYKTQNNISEFAGDTERYNHKERPSLTVPDQTLSLQTLLERHTRSMYVPQHNVHYDPPGTELPDFEKLSLEERDAFIENSKEHLEELKAEGKKKIKDLREERIKLKNQVQPAPAVETNQTTDK